MRNTSQLKKNSENHFTTELTLPGQQDQRVLEALAADLGADVQRGREEAGEHAEHVARGQADVGVGEVDAEQGGRVVVGGANVVLAREWGDGDGVVVVDGLVVRQPTIHVLLAPERGPAQAAQHRDERAAHDGLKIGRLSSRMQIKIIK